jgi:hypothetical protein
VRHFAPEQDYAVYMSENHPTISAIRGRLRWVPVVAWMVGVLFVTAGNSDEAEAVTIRSTNMLRPADLQEDPLPHNKDAAENFRRASIAYGVSLGASVALMVLDGYSLGNPKPTAAGSSGGFRNNVSVYVAPGRATLVLRF